MNKTLIAAAVSAAVAAPVASADITVYGRVNNAIDLNDLSSKVGDESTTDISTVASRFGLKGSTDLGNGLTVHGQYEFGTVSDRESFSDDGHSPTDVRVASAGVSGSFGRLDVGNLWSAYNKTVGTLISPTYSLGFYLYSSVGGGLFRTSNTIQYSNSWGPVGAVLDIRLNDADEGSDVAEKANGNGWGLGVNYQVTSNFSLTAAYDNEDGDTTTTTIVPSLVALPAVATLDAVANDPTTEPQRVAFDAARQQQIDRRAAWRKRVDAISGHLGYDPVTADTAVAVTAAYTARATAINALTVMNGGLLPNGEKVTKGVEDLDLITQPGVAAKRADPVVPNADLPLIGVETAAAAVAADESETTAEDTERTGIAARYSFGDYYVQGGLQSMEKGDAEVDTYFIYGGGPIGQKTTWLLGYAEADDGNEATEDDANQLVWGLYHNVGGGLRLYYEAISLENESKNQDGERHLLGIRVDF